MVKVALLSTGVDLVGCTGCSQLALVFDSVKVNVKVNTKMQLWVKIPISAHFSCWFLGGRR